MPDRTEKQSSKPQSRRSRGRVATEPQREEAKESLKSTSGSNTGTEIHNSHTHVSHIEGRRSASASTAGSGSSKKIDWSTPRSPDSDQAADSSVPASRSYRQHIELAGVGAQFNNADLVQNVSRRAQVERGMVCPYHKPVQQQHSQHRPSGQGMVPMDRYLTERAPERYAILGNRYPGEHVRPHGCRCLELVHSGVGVKGSTTR